jgi:citrate synthase
MAPTSKRNETIWISADEAAHRLGVSKPTLYAYVSRGKIGRTLAEDGRRSRFNAAEVAVLGRGKPKPPSPGMTELRLTSAVTRLDETMLFYRGVPIGSLIGKESFESVAALLWQQEPSTWDAERKLVEQIVSFRTLSTQISHHSEKSEKSGKGENAQKGQIDLGDQALPAGAKGAQRSVSSHRPGRAASQLAQLVLQIGCLHSSTGFPAVGNQADQTAGQVVVDQTSEILSVLSASLAGVRTSDRTVASRLWRHLSQRAPRQGELELIDAILVALADHELATATLAVRLAASTRADLYAAIASGLTVLTGPLHGSASAGCYRMLASAAASGRPARAVDEALADFGLVHGFGHKVYKQSDPRSVALLDLLHQADIDRGKRAVVDAVLAEVKTRIPQQDNVDFALGAITLCCDLPAWAGELLFCFARIAGWAAHYLEELAEPPLRFRVRAVYRGE